ncbi:MAG: Spy/CpxP family protein refolding chaperone [Thermodesulfobacteriota bacterium]
MKTKIKFMAVSVLVLVGLCLSAYSTFAFSGPHGRGGEIRRIKWVLEKGGQPLTDAQKTQIKDIMTTSRTQMKPAITQARTARRALRDLILSGTATDAQIMGQVDAIVPLGTAIAEQRARTFNQIVTQVLTADQRSVLQQFKGPKTP